jgi:CheY-like chemotaxis protein
MGSRQTCDVIDILLVEDSPGDVRLTREALKEGKVRNNLYVCADGVEALDFVRGRGQYAGAVRPDLILLDLNMPKKDGREVLAEIKADPELKSIPVVILATSEAEQDILMSYNLHANCYISKPVDLGQFMHVVNNIQNFPELLGRHRQAAATLLTWPTIRAKAQRPFFHLLQRYKTAHIIGAPLPELLARLPPEREPWMSEDPRMAIFDTAAFALALFGSERKVE